MKKIFLLILLWVLPAYSQEYTENNTSYDINWADVNAKNNDGETALITASKLNDYKTVKRLIDAGADVNAKNNDGETALIAATKIGDDKADDNCDHNYGHYTITCLKVIEIIDVSDIIKALIAAGADVNIKNNDGTTALIEALSTDSLFSEDIAKLLIDAGADVNIKK